MTELMKRGESAVLLQRQLGLSRYETAWIMLHKLRRAMVNAAREPLHGEVEVDDTWIGGPQAGLRGSRQLKGRRASLVMVDVEKRGKRSGRVRMSVIPDFKKVTIDRYLGHNICSRLDHLHRRSEDFCATSKRRGYMTRLSSATITETDIEERRQVGGAAGGSCHWQPAAMADRNVPRREPRSASSLPR